MQILIASAIDQSAILSLRELHDVICAFSPKQEELESLVKDREVLVFRSGVAITESVMASAPNLKLIVRAGCGLDNIDLECVNRRGIRLVRIPGPAAQGVAEMVFALMLALARNLREADRLLRQGRWAKHELEGYLLAGKVLGIVGVGNIGTRVGQLGVALGMEVIGCVERPSPARAAHFGEMGISLTNFDNVISHADFVSIHLPLKDSTRDIIDSRAISRVKQGAFFINTARGGVVDEGALYQALVAGGRLRGAGLDVHRQEGAGAISPLAELPNVLLTPHIASMTSDTQREIGRRVVEIVDAFASESVETSEKALVGE